MTRNDFEHLLKIHDVPVERIIEFFEGPGTIAVKAHLPFVTCRRLARELRCYIPMGIWFEIQPTWEVRTQ